MHNDLWRRQTYIFVFNSYKGWSKIILGLTGSKNAILQIFSGKVYFSQFVQSCSFELNKFHANVQT